jgi:hypothetical protein
MKFQEILDREIKALALKETKKESNQRVMPDAEHMMRIASMNPPQFAYTNNMLFKRSV